MPRRSATATNRALAAERFETARILATYDAASAAERAEGVTWYQTAHDTARSYAADYGVSVSAAAGIIAALSPQLSWDLNLRYAETFLASDGEPSGHFGLCDDRARAILNGADPLDTLGGPKVRSFYRNIYGPTLAGPVTVDRHACAILYGSTTPEYLSACPKLLDRRYLYNLCAARYRAAARETGLLPHEIQAVCWVTHRNQQAARIPYATDTSPGF